MKILEAKAAVNKKWEKSKNIPAPDVKKIKSKSESHQSSEEGCRTCKTPPEIQGSSCDETTFKTKKDTEQYSPSKVLQRL